MALTTIKAAGLTADLIDETKLADNSIDSEHYNDGSIDTAHIADDAVTTDKLANAINTDIAAKAVLTGSTDNTLVTVTGANAIQGEAKLTFDGDTLKFTHDAVTGFDSNSQDFLVIENGDSDTYINIATEANRDSGLLFSDGVRAEGYITYNHATNDLCVSATDDIWFRNAGSESLRILSTGFVGIGQASPETLLNIKGNDTAYSGGVAVGAIMQAEDSAGRKVQLVAPGSVGEAGVGTPTNHILTFFTGNTERARLDTSGKLLLNTTAVTHTDDFLTIKRPAGNHYATTMSLDATSATANAANALIYTKSKDYYYNGLIFESSTGHQGGICGKMTANGGTTPQIEIRIGGSGFASSDIAALTVYANGDVGLGDGNLKVANTHGIDFSAQTATSATGASTSSELFDHYEEGTWTPTMLGSGGGSWVGGSSIVGNYTRIGRMVHAQYAFRDFNATSSTISGDITMGGLPFTNNAAIYTGDSGVYNVDVPANHTGNFMVHVPANSTSIYLYWDQDNAGSAVLNSAHFKNGSYIQGTITYFV